MQKKQVKPKTSAKAPAKKAPAAKAPAKPAKAAAKAPARSAAKGGTKTAAKAPTKSAANAAKPSARPGAKAPAEATVQAAQRAATAATTGPRHRHNDPSTALPKPKQAPAVAPPIPSRAFSFEDAGRTFNCRVEPLRPSGTDAWWWFEVSTEQHQRHAPFRAEPEDTPEQVQKRMVRYYDELLARRAEPAPNRWNRRPGAPAAATGDAGATATAVAPEAGVDEVEGDLPDDVDLEGEEGEDADAPADDAAEDAVDED